MLPMTSLMILIVTLALCLTMTSSFSLHSHRNFHSLNQIYRKNNNNKINNRITPLQEKKQDIAGDKLVWDAKANRFFEAKVDDIPGNE